MVNDMENTAVKNMASQLATGQAPNDKHRQITEGNDRNYKVSLGNLKNKFEQVNHYQPQYEVKYKRSSLKMSKSGNTASGEVFRPNQAGTREQANYSQSFNKSTLSNLKSMFEAKNSSSNDSSKSKSVVDYTRPVTKLAVNKSAQRTASVEPVNSNTDSMKTVAGEREKPAYVPSVSMQAAKNMFSKTKPDEYKPKQKFQASTSTQNADGVVKSGEIVDDRPKELSTSLLSARAMFEQSNKYDGTLGNTPSKSIPVATWEGKDSDNSILQAAKARFEADSPTKLVQQSDNDVSEAIQQKENSEVESIKGYNSTSSQSRSRQSSSSSSAHHEQTPDQLSQVQIDSPVTPSHSEDEPQQHQEPVVQTQIESSEIESPDEPVEIESKPVDIQPTTSASTTVSEHIRSQQEELQQIEETLMDNEIRQEENIAAIVNQEIAISSHSDEEQEPETSLDNLPESSQQASAITSTVVSPGLPTSPSHEQAPSNAQNNGRISSYESEDVLSDASGSSTSEKDENKDISFDV